LLEEEEEEKEKRKEKKNLRKLLKIKRNFTALKKI